MKRDTIMVVATLLSSMMVGCTGGNDEKKPSADALPEVVGSCRVEVAGIYGAWDGFENLEIPHWECHTKYTEKYCTTGHEQGIIIEGVFLPNGCDESGIVATCHGDLRERHLVAQEGLTESEWALIQERFEDACYRGGWTFSRR